MMMMAMDDRDDDECHVRNMTSVHNFAQILCAEQRQRQQVMVERQTHTKLPVGIMEIVLHSNEFLSFLSCDATKHHSPCSTHTHTARSTFLCNLILLR